MLSKEVTAAAIAILFLATDVNGHGHLVSPRSRNFVAHQDGLWWPADGSTPQPENCSHCKLVYSRFRIDIDHSMTSALLFLKSNVLTSSFFLSSLQVSILVAQKQAVAWSPDVTMIPPRIHLAVT